MTIRCPKTSLPRTPKKFLTEYLKVYNEEEEKDIWFQKIKELCEPHRLHA